MGVSQNQGYPLGAPKIGIIVYRGLLWVPPILRNYHIGEYCKGVEGGY